MSNTNKEEFFYTPNAKHIKDGFYAVEETGWTPVNKYGILLLESGGQQEGYITPGYRCTTNAKGEFYLETLCNDGKMRRVHRVVALTFLQAKANPSELDINHIDGNPSNNCLSNLEWVTRRENNLHAVENNLNTQNQWVKFRDLLTGETLTMSSIQQVARKINCSGGSIANYLQSARNKPFWGRYALCFNKEALKEFDCKDISLFGRKVKDVDVLVGISDDKTKPMVAFPSKKLLEEELGKEIEVERDIDGYKYYYLADVISFTENLEDFYTNVVMHHDLVPTSKGNRSGSKPSPVTVTNIYTGETKQYNGLFELAEEWGTTYVALRKLIWRHKGHVNGFIITYVKEKKSGRRTEEN